MIRIENECVDCGLPCMGSSCPYQNVERHYCDKCGDEEVLYNFNGGEYCMSCIEDMIEEIPENERGCCDGCGDVEIPHFKVLECEYCAECAVEVLESRKIN